MQHKSQTTISLALTNWYLQAARELPWRETTDPFRIWLSEIILQQTRVEQGLPYYEAFTSRFENVRELAEAEDDEVMRLWQGLGYYSRARNLLKTARLIVGEWNGKFPDNSKELLQLPGIGAYTSAAIASFAFGEAKGAVDGNVLRVLSRLYDIDLSIDEGRNKRVFQELADELIKTADPAIFNQATMELGATVCKPKPNCPDCPLLTHCAAYANDTISSRPIRTKKLKVKEQQLHYALFLNQNGQIAIQQRPQKGIWSGLYELIPIGIQENSHPNGDSWYTEHKLSHRLLKIHFHKLEIPIDLNQDNWLWLEPKELHRYAFPVPILAALEKWSLL